MLDSVQLGLFLLVGAVNTLLDFCVFNLLTQRAVGMQRIPANLLSASVGMTFSYFVNGTLVFSAPRIAVPLPVINFFAVNMISLYVVQTLIIGLATQIWPSPVHWLSERLVC